MHNETRRKQFPSRDSSREVSLAINWSVYLYIDRISDCLLSVCFQDYCPDPEKYFNLMKALERSKPKRSIENILEATKPMKPFASDADTKKTLGGDFADFADLAYDILDRLTSTWN